MDEKPAQSGPSWKQWALPWLLVVVGMALFWLLYELGYITIYQATG